MFGRDFCPHCGTFHSENWQVSGTETEQNDEQVIAGTTYRCKHCEGLYRFVEVFDLVDTDSIRLFDKN